MENQSKKAKKEVVEAEMPLGLSMLTWIESENFAFLINSKICVSISSEIIRILRVRFPSIADLLRNKLFVQTHTDQVYLKGFKSVLIYMPREIGLSIEPPIVCMTDPIVWNPLGSVVEVPRGYPYWGGCCHGVVCLYSGTGAVCLINPITLAQLKVEAPPIDPGLCPRCFVYIGFDKSILKFKLVCIQIVHPKNENLRNDFWYIKTIGINNDDWRCVSTRRIEPPRHGFGIWDDCLYLPQSDNKVVVFVDLQREVVMDLGPPGFMKSSWDLGEDDRVQVVGFCGINHIDDTYVEFWARGNGGSISHDVLRYRGSNRVVMHLYPVCVYNNILLLHDTLQNELIICDIRRGSAYAVIVERLHYDFYCSSLYDTLVSRERIVEVFE